MTSAADGSLLRLAVADDLPAVEAIVEAAYSPFIARIGRTPGPMLDDYAALIADGRVHVSVASGTVEAILVLIPQEGSMLLDNVAVAPHAQRKGIGRKLMAFAEDQARAAGYRFIRLYTNQLMHENIALYGRLGYRETHRGVEKGLHRVYMTKALDEDGS